MTDENIRQTKTYSGRKTYDGRKHITDEII